MSINLSVEIPLVSDRILFVNATGMNPEGIKIDEFVLYFYCMDVNTAELQFSFSLSINQSITLFNHLNGFSFIREGTIEGQRKFIEVNESQSEILDLIKSAEIEVVKRILTTISSSEKLSTVLSSLSKIELQNMHAAIRQAEHKKAIGSLKEMLKFENDNVLKEMVNTEADLEPYRANQPERIFQKWIEKNIWSLGIDYIKKHNTRVIGLSTEADILMESVDGYVDLIELKRPKFDLFAYDSSHKSFYPSTELAKVLGQSLKYLNDLDIFRLQLEKQYKFKVLRPRIKIIIGRSNTFDEAQNDALRMLNSGLSNIQVITYDALLLGAENILSYYDKQVETADGEILPAIS